MNNHMDGIYTTPERQNWLNVQGIKTARRYDNSGVILLTPKKLGYEFLHSLFLDRVDVAKTHTF